MARISGGDLVPTPGERSETSHWPWTKRWRPLSGDLVPTARSTLLAKKKSGRSHPLFVAQQPLLFGNNLFDRRHDRLDLFIGKSWIQREDGSSDRVTTP